MSKEEEKPDVDLELEQEILDKAIELQRLQNEELRKEVERLEENLKEYETQK